MDNSEYMRNGDFLPSRLQAQQDAVGMVDQAKLRSNENKHMKIVHGKEKGLACSSYENQR